MTRIVLEAIHRAAVWLVLAPVVFYRRVLSPLKGAPTCRFLPTCSEYAIEAVRTRGLIVGGLLASRRICRCHPFGGSGFDPVPRSLSEGVH